MNSIRLCGGLREIFNSPSFPHLAYFPNAHIVQYLFYIGQLDFIDEKFTLVCYCVLSFLLSGYRLYHSDRDLV